MPKPRTSGATATSSAVKRAPDKFKSPYVQISADDRPTSGNTTPFTLLNEIASNTTTTSTASRIRVARLSNVPSSISLEIKSSDATP